MDEGISLDECSQYGMKKEKGHGVLQYTVIIADLNHKLAMIHYTKISAQATNSGKDISLLT